MTRTRRATKRLSRNTARGSVREPSIWAALSYAAVHILAEAIENAETPDSVGIRDALADISDLDTILGQFSFSEVGDGAYDPTVLIVKDGKLEVFGEGGM